MVKSAVRMDSDGHPKEVNISDLRQLLLYPLLPKNGSWTSAAVGLIRRQLWLEST